MSSLEELKEIAIRDKASYDAARQAYSKGDIYSREFNFQVAAYRQAETCYLDSARRFFEAYLDSTENAG